MKKALLALTVGLLALAVQSPASAQNVSVKNETITFNKETHSALAAHYPYSEDALKSVFAKRMEKANLPKAKSASNKFRVINGAVWGTISKDKMDYYYRISGSKSKSTLEFLISKGYNNFVTPETSPAIFQNLSNFMTSLKTGLYDYHIDVLIAAKEKEVKKAQKDLKKSQKKVKKAQDKVKKAQGKVKDKQKDADKKQSVIDKLKGEIQALQGKKK